MLDTIDRLRCHWSRNLTIYSDIIDDFCHASGYSLCQEDLRMIHSLRQSQRNLSILARKAEILMLACQDSIARASTLTASLLEAVKGYRDDLIASDQKAAILLARMQNRT